MHLHKARFQPNRWPPQSYADVLSSRQCSQSSSLLTEHNTNYTHETLCPAPADVRMVQADHYNPISSSLFNDWPRGEHVIFFFFLVNEIKSSGTVAKKAFPSWQQMHRVDGALQPSLPPPPRPLPRFRVLRAVMRGCNVQSYGSHLVTMRRPVTCHGWRNKKKSKEGPGRRDLTTRHGLRLPM